VLTASDAAEHTPAPKWVGANIRRGASTALRTLAESPTVVVCVLLVGLGVALRMRSLGLPEGFTFDEHHFVDNARNYLRGAPDGNDHPPLGKLTIAVSIWLLGDTAFAWRLPALIAGLFIVASGAVLARRLFPTPLAAWLAAGLLAADGFLIAYSRTGLIDGQLTALSLGALTLAVVRPRSGMLVVAGLLAGLAANVKFSGIAALGPIALVLSVAPMSRRRRASTAVGAALAFALGYLTPWWIGLAMTHQPAGVGSVVAKTWQLAQLHATATTMGNSLASSWPTWLVSLKPIVMSSVGPRAATRMAIALGNPLTWLASTFAVLASLGAIVWIGARRTLERVETPAAASTGYWATHGFGSMVLVVGWVAFLSPWILTRRDPYIYHYLPCYALAVILLAGALSWIAQRRRRVVLVFALLVLDVAAFYTPVWARLPLTQEALESRLLLRSWR